MKQYLLPFVHYFKHCNKLYFFKFIERNAAALSQSGSISKLTHFCPFPRKVLDLELLLPPCNKGEKKEEDISKAFVDIFILLNFHLLRPIKTIDFHF